MRTRDRVTSACQRWWLWTTVTGDVVTQGQSSQGRRGAGVHGSTPYHRLATSAVSVALAKAAQAGFPRRGRPRPRKPGSSFGRWSPYLQIPPRQGPLHSLKGMVPEASAHVPFVVCGRCVGGSAAQRRSSTPASAGMRRWQLACDYTMLATELASDFDSLCSSWQLACDFSSRYALLCLCCCYVPKFVCFQLVCDLSMCSVFEFDLIDRIRSWTWCRSPFAALVTCRRGSARRAENIYYTRIIILENGRSVKNAHAHHVGTRTNPPRLRQASRTHTHAHTRTRVFSLSFFHRLRYVGETDRLYIYICIYLHI